MIKRVQSVNSVVKAPTKTRKDRPVVENAMEESRRIPWEPCPVRIVSKVSKYASHTYIGEKELRDNFL